MTRRWQLGSVLPAVMMVALLLDVGMRFTSLDWVAFRTWEPALRHSGAGLGPFEPNKVVVKRHAYGDLASMGNLVSFREYRSQELRVDKFGYRNSYPVDRATTAGIVLGDSFIVAIDEPEELTLPGQLTKLANRYYYNAGSRDSASPEAVGLLASQLKLSSGVVVYELLERQARNPPPPMAEVQAPVTVPITATVADPPPPLHKLAVFANLKAALRSQLISPAKIVSQKILKRVQNDVLLPNPFANKAVRRKMQNGDEMLFTPWDLEPVGDVDGRSSTWCSYLSAFSDRMAERDLKTVILLVPNKATVYDPLSQNAPQQPPGARLLDRIARELGAAGVPVVNLTAAFRNDAAQGLPRNEYLYWRDDTHWKARGISIAAAQLWSRIQIAQQAGAIRKTRPY